MRFSSTKHSWIFLLILRHLQFKSIAGNGFLRVNAKFDIAIALGRRAKGPRKCLRSTLLGDRWMLGLTATSGIAFVIGPCRTLTKCLRCVHDRINQCRLDRLTLFGRRERRLSRAVPTWSYFGHDTSESFSGQASTFFARHMWIWKNLLSATKWDLLETHPAK